MLQPMTASQEGTCWISNRCPRIGFQFDTLLRNLTMYWCFLIIMTLTSPECFASKTGPTAAASWNSFVSDESIVAADQWQIGKRWLATRLFINHCQTIDQAHFRLSHSSFSISSPPGLFDRLPTLYSTLRQFEFLPCPAVRASCFHTSRHGGKNEIADRMYIETDLSEPASKCLTMFLQFSIFFLGRRCRAMRSPTTS